MARSSQNISHNCSRQCDLFNLTSTDRSHLIKSDVYDPFYSCKNIVNHNNHSRHDKHLPISNPKPMFSLSNFVLSETFQGRQTKFVPSIRYAYMSSWNCLDATRLTRVCWVCLYVSSREAGNRVTFVWSRLHNIFLPLRCEERVPFFAVFSPPKLAANRSNIWAE